MRRYEWLYCAILLGIGFHTVLAGCSPEGSSGSPLSLHDRLRAQMGYGASSASAASCLTDGDSCTSDEQCCSVNGCAALVCGGPSANSSAVSSLINPSTSSSSVPASSVASSSVPASSDPASSVPASSDPASSVPASSAASSAPVCGNGVVESGEACDLTDFGPGQDGTCTTYDPVNYNTGNLSCAVNCSAVNTSGCSLVGSSAASVSSVSSPAASSSVASSVSSPAASSSIASSVPSSVASSASSAFCGNGLLESGEYCDYAITNSTLADYRANCRAAPAAVKCTACGDGTLQASVEECDFAAGPGAAGYSATCNTSCIDAPGIGTTGEPPPPPRSSAGSTASRSSTPVDPQETAWCCTTATRQQWKCEVDQKPIGTCVGTTIFPSKVPTRVACNALCHPNMFCCNCATDDQFYNPYPITGSQSCPDLFMYWRAGDPTGASSLLDTMQVRCSLYCRNRPNSIGKTSTAQ